MEIKTLVDDIYGLLDRGVHYTPNPTNLTTLTENINEHFIQSMAAKSKPREFGKLWFSDLGERCTRKLWYKFNKPEIAETFQGHTLFKFIYGNLIEEQALFLATEAGHSVTRRQDRAVYDHTASGWQVTGRIDAEIDGVLVDVKSTSSIGYSKYIKGLTEENDKFNYRWQVSGYKVALGYTNNPQILLVDKQNGHLGLVEVESLSKDALDLWLNETTTALGSDLLPSMGHAPVPEGKSGNKKLGTECSYCPYKWECHQNLRGFLYSSGPVYLTHVVREPNVPEILLTDTDSVDGLNSSDSINTTV